MFFLGILALIQITFLPGFLILKLIKFNSEKIIRTILFSFALSLIFNFFIIFSLTAVGIYVKVAVYILFAFELILLIYFIHPFLKKSLNINIFQSRFQKIENYLTNFFKNFGFIKLIKIAIFFLSVNYIRIFLNYVTHNFFTVFSKNDPIISWNKWALEWANNLLPSNTWHYTQLIPTNWSLTYVFMDDLSVQFFAKAIMPLFSFFILLAIFDLGLIKKKIGYFIGLIVTVLLITKYFGIYFIISGFVDLPVACMCFLSIYSLLIAQDISDKKKQIKYIFLGAIIAAGSALTKQAGLFMVCLYPLLVYFFIFKDHQQFSKNEKISIILKIIGIAFILIIPWYAYKEIQIYLGLDFSEIKEVTQDLYGGKGYWLRIIDTFKNFYFIYLALLIAIFNIKKIDKNFYYLTFFICIPFILIWALFFSYGIRNCALVFPVLGLCAGFGLKNAFLFFQKYSDKIKIFYKIKLIYIILILILVFFGLNFYFSKDFLINKQIKLQKSIGSSVLNKNLYSYKEENNINGKILTDYRYLYYLPELEDRYLWFNFKEKEIADINPFITQIKDDNIKYILYPPQETNQIISDYIQEKIDEEKYEIVFEVNKYVFINILFK
ncbi:MAG: hypothetical protein ABIF17_03940 [Patescibacteria group bacterium]